ncbi:hypothetical protein L1049_016246 [Liquidambar formosana]|uniref:SANT domain-containing protein n=1 Tax=Liquidambar formosana TaxID=63359 RepID=A0AAP0RYZ0_LIQFO
MEMDLVELNHNGDFVEDTSGELLLSLGPVDDMYNVFGDPEVLPRVGDQYQVEIPPLMEKTDYLQLTKSPTHTDIMAGQPIDFLMGLSIPIMWISVEVEKIKNKSLEFLGDSIDAFNKFSSDNITKIHMHLKVENSEVKVDPLDNALDSGLRLGVSANLALKQEMNGELHWKYRFKACLLVPGSLGESWSDIEEASFLLGLYIFGKNLVQVKRFIESKKMGDILSFYYGKFYKSDKYRRWSECRKMRSRRCIYGQKIFTGVRQQELLSRLLPHFSEECQNALLEVSKTFGEGKMLLEEYVSTLKAMVGMNSLIEAVGIGKGKQDLTGISLEPLKCNQVVPVRPEIPIGKACSSLTTREVIKFLTGDFRLSKARSSDLFWEAVWPRLLARGWHSEQPKDHGYAAGSKNSLVFLMPGVKKFSRRKLVKGDHYFDSVSDVLSKVTSDPGLLELEIETDKGNRIKEDYGLTDETKMDQDDLSGQQRHCYLQPRTPNRSTDLLKITVVDTSLANGEKFKVREVRCLPVEISNTSTSRSHSEEIDRDSSQESQDEADSANNLFFDHELNKNFRPTKMFGKGVFSDRKDSESSASNRGFPSYGLDSPNVPEKIHKDKNTNLCDDKQPRKATKCHLSRRTRPDYSNYLAPITKRRRRLTACSRTETSHSTKSFLVGPKLKQKEPFCHLVNPASNENILSQVDPSQEKLSSTSSSPKNSPIESSEGILSSTCLSAEHPHEKPQCRTLIDLNLPVPLDAETDEPFMMEAVEKQDDQTSKQPDDPRALKTSIGAASSEPHPDMNSRRQSTRNRPPTARALEALASGYLNIKQRRKRSEAFPRDNSVSRPSRRARGRVRVTENFSTDFVDSKVKEVENGVSSNGAMFNEFQVQSEGKGSQVSGPPTNLPT